MAYKVNVDCVAYLESYSSVNPVDLRKVSAILDMLGIKSYHLAQVLGVSESALSHVWSGRTQLKTRERREWLIDGVLDMIGIIDSVKDDLVSRALEANEGTSSFCRDMRERGYGDYYDELYDYFCVIIPSYKMKLWEEVERLIELRISERSSDEMNVDYRLDELLRLCSEDGWNEGEGKALDRDKIEWLRKLLNENYSRRLPDLYLYPDEDSGIMIEWEIQRFGVSLEVDVESRKGKWICLDCEKEDDDEEAMETKEFKVDTKGWAWVLDDLRNKMKMTEMGLNKEKVKGR